MAAVGYGSTIRSAPSGAVPASLVPHPREELFTVLVVDDHPLLREAIASRLVTMGAVIDTQRDTERLFENAAVTSVAAHGPHHQSTSGPSAPSAPAGGAIDRDMPSPQQHSL